MKIVQIITGSSSFGGAEAHVRDLAVGLRSRGHDCTVLLGPPEGLLCAQLQSAGVPFVMISALKKPIHPVWDVISLYQVLQVLWRLRPDVVATHTSKAGFIGRVAAKLLGIRSFFTPHGLSFINRQDGKLILFRLLLEKIALCLGSEQIAVCDAERQLAIRLLWIDEKKISTIHNGLPIATPPRPKEKRRLVITMVARFDIQKDHATLLRALYTLRHLDWELWLAGDGPLLPAILEMARRYDLASHIEFITPCSDIPGLLAQTDIFVLSSNWEAFPISILEAMRAGLPVIATNTGGVSEAVHDGENGFLVEQQNIAQLAEKISRLIQSPTLRIEMGTKAQAQFVSMFDWRHMLDKIEMLYTSAVKLSDSAPSAVSNSFMLERPGVTPSDDLQVIASRRSPFSSAVALLAVDCSCLAVALWLSLLIDGLFGRAPSHGVVLQLCVIVAASVIMLAMNGLYPALGTSGLVESKRIFKGISFVQNFNFLIFWMIGAQKYQLSLIVVFWVLSILLVLLGRASTRSLLSRQTWWGESVLLVGSGSQMQEIAQLLQDHDRLGLHVAGILNEEGESNPHIDVPVFSKFESATAFCLRAKVQTAVVILSTSQGHTVSVAASRYSAYFPNLILFPLIEPRSTFNSRAQVLSRQLSIEAALVSLMRNRRRLKRCIDFAMALCAGVLLSPLLLAIAVLVKLTSRGPVFFGHRRVGRYGKTFKAWKFRTMVMDAEAHLANRLAASPELRAEWERDHKLRNDPRVTKVGAFLRKYSLDELPQLWNAIRSEMSIVGPRPIIEEEIVKYSDCFHCYSRVLPGITGLWQVSGRNETSYDERVELDTYYVNSWSLWLDLYIIGRSFTAVFHGRGAY